MSTKKTDRKSARVSKARSKGKRRRAPTRSRPMTPAEMQEFEERVVKKNRPAPRPPKPLIAM